MLRRETGGILRHYNPLAGHPLWLDVAGWVRGARPEIGRTVQVTCTRRVAGGARDDVLRSLARDVEILAAVAGDIRQVSAIGPGDASSSFASLQVQMTSSSAATLRWSVAPTSQTDASMELTLVGEHGTLTFSSELNASQMPENAPVPTGDGRQHIVFSLRSAPMTAIRELETAVLETDAVRRSAYSTWQTATRAMEIVDAVELSLERGRTIEVHQQQLTEQTAFRGTMAAFGCGLLLLGTAVMFIMGLLGGVEAVLQQPLFRGWAGALLAVLAVFLLLQAVPFVASSRKRAVRESDEARDTN
jgi:hypothetical protein